MQERTVLAGLRAAVIWIRTTRRLMTAGMAGTENATQIH